MIRRNRHKKLKLLYEKGETSGFDAHDIRRLRQILQRLDAAERPEELDLPGLYLHRLRGNRKNTWAVTVRTNYRVTFRMDAEGQFIDVDYEDYH
ncbi:MAG: type II toxin-antitoxin system RelE/ParE family toxin [Gammaproteobacteria bacterium]